MELLLGPDGEYIREIIIDELAKGIDAGWRSSLDSFIGSSRSRLLRAFRVSHAAVVIQVWPVDKLLSELSHAWHQVCRVLHRSGHAKGMLGHDV